MPIPAKYGSGRAEVGAWPPLKERRLYFTGVLPFIRLLYQGLPTTRES